MTDLKLAKLPDRSPVKITITVRPDLNGALQTYAELYRESYGEEETVAELIPYILQTFLDSDRELARTLREKGAEGEGDRSRQRRPQNTPTESQRT